MIRDEEVNPCIDCKPPKRTCTCHDTCKEFLKWKAKHDKLIKKIKKKIYIESL